MALYWMWTSNATLHQIYIIYDTLLYNYVGFQETWSGFVTETSQSTIIHVSTLRQLCKCQLPSTLLYSNLPVIFMKLEWMKKTQRKIVFSTPYVPMNTCDCRLGIKVYQSLSNGLRDTIHLDTVTGNQNVCLSWSYCHIRTIAPRA